MGSSGCALVFCERVESASDNQNIKYIAQALLSEKLIEKIDGFCLSGDGDGFNIVCINTINLAKFSQPRYS